MIFDQRSMALRAWHGDGTGYGSADGVIARLQTVCAGVSVVSLGDEGENDFFTGTYWVRRLASGEVKVVNMASKATQSEWAQPTVADVDGDGKAEVVFGTSDGRVFMYRTELAYHAEKMQWPTAQGNFQHTGCWHRPGGK